MSEAVLGSLLVVVDDEELRQQLTDALLSAGHDVAVAASSPEAVGKVRSFCYDLALIGLRLPDMGSVDLVARLRQTCPDLGVLALDDGSADMALEAMRCGALDCVAQGAPTHEIVTRVQRALVARERELRSAPPTQHVPVPESDMAPAAIAATIGEKVSLAKAALPWVNVLVLGVLAGAYIGFGGLAATLVWVDAASTVGLGLSRIPGGLLFSIGLIVMVTGALRGHLGVGNMPARWVVVWRSGWPPPRGRCPARSWPSCSRSLSSWPWASNTV